MKTGEAAFLGFSPSDILVERTRVSTLPLCQTSCPTFAWLIFFTFCVISFAISFSEAMNAVTGSSSAQLPIVIGRRNTG